MFEQLLMLLMYYQTTAINPPAGIPKTEAIMMPLTEEQLAPTEAAEKPTPDPALIAPVLDAHAVFVQDLRSETVLYQKNINEPIRMASITKLMTTIVILDNHSLDEVVTVSKAATQTDGVKVWVYDGEKITVRDLLYSTLIASGNDAAAALAIYDSGTEIEFVEKMNKKAREIGLLKTNFTNATGLDWHDNYSTAHDISLLARAALEYDFIRGATAKSKLTIISISGTKHELTSTNKLLGHPTFNVLGLKTGRTDGAGPSLVTLTRHPDGAEILTVVMNSKDRFGETEFLLDWIYRKWNWQ